MYSTVTGSTTNGVSASSKLSRHVILILTRLQLQIIYTSQQSTGDRGHSTSASDWHIRFTLPELNSFSQHIKGAVNTGVVTARARKEINQVLRTYI